MNKEVKELWLEALRSGKFRQGRSALNKGNTFCCLGVLCELAYRRGIVGKDIDATNYYDDAATALPLRVRKWAGVDSDPVVKGSNLSPWNDQGHSFIDIADMIEQEL